MVNLDKEDALASLQIFTVPQLKDDKILEEESLEASEKPRNCEDDYEDYKNEEINSLNNK